MNVRILMNQNVKGGDQTCQKHYASNWSAADPRGGPSPTFSQALASVRIATGEFMTDQNRKLVCDFYELAFNQHWPPVQWRI